ncbi:bifunctional aminoglycoside phosphotransferase/ATP-binding protein [Frigoriglobus tundricola]|uniref:Aminoglycoside phosphotransferase domain-containing protein n=1 Tax=Frigoriglobus tundricola TaxID=2774151 RepID=A0A6M5YZ74_9BACT|nr:bifunctional aminoglycoside phosphotransferase/ATP-binding protein [Frigoriglobus tundricola]QJW98834.1 hypothetical protein FTUN_6429 [Frigoriglobus tundricola]
MELGKLIDALRDAAADVVQTHISVVVLTGDLVYKLKKPVNLGFLDFSTLERRKRFCEEEVRLNRRLAPTVYLGVVPVARGAGGRVRFEGEGEVLEWAVKMRRLPAGASFLERLQGDDLPPALLEAFAVRLAEFHRRAEAGPRVAESGRHEVVARNARDNFVQSAAQIGVTVSRTLFDRLHGATEAALERLRPLIEARAARGVPRDTHGDLHLDHVYSFPDRAPPDDLVAIDCIEFSESFRHADPIADAAFLAMDLAFRGRRDLAAAFTARYLLASDDAEGAALFPFYIAYRAAVRAKVDGMTALEEEIPEPKRAEARTLARAHWLLALGSLESADRRPALVLVAGLPGTGKSTLARGLAERGHLALVRSDVVRKELAGVAPDAPGEGLYTPEWTARTYAECLRRAEAVATDGGRVIVDANFPDENRRRDFLNAAERLAVPAVLLWCRADPGVAKRRITARRSDASDATVAVHDTVAARWQDFDPRTRRLVREVNADGAPEDTLARGVAVLREAKVM